MPATILSRCQCFEFVRIPAGEIVARLQQVARAEGFELEERAAELIARLSDGGAEKRALPFGASAPLWEIP